MALQEELKIQGDFLFKYRSHLPLGLLIVGLGVKMYQGWFLGEAHEGIFAGTLESTAIIAGSIGLAIRAFTVGYTPKNTSGRNTVEGQVADELNTRGIYSIIRNPLYLGNYLMWLAIAMLTENIWFVLLFSLVFWIYYERIVYAEEQFLRKKFGKTYLDWATKTPIFLPKHLNYLQPKIDFSWKKVVKKEKNGFFALFLLFWLFEAIGAYFKGGGIPMGESWTFIGVIISGVLYLILKYIKKNTTVLDEEGR